MRDKRIQYVGRSTGAEKTDRRTEFAHTNTVKTRNLQNLTNCEIFFKTIKAICRPSLQHLSSCRSNVGEPNGTRISFATDGFINRPHLLFISLTKLYPLRNSEIFFQPITVLYRTSLKHFTACR